MATALVVDDSSPMRMLLRKTLGELGFEMREAAMEEGHWPRSRTNRLPSLSVLRIGICPRWMASNFSRGSLRLRNSVPWSPSRPSWNTLPKRWMREPTNT